MKSLTLLRHAKSDWTDAVARDFDRPLNDRGRRAARTMGAYIKTHGLTFDRVLASPALRVRQTLDQIERGCGFAFAAMFDARIYLASASSLLDLVRETGEEAERMLLVGHNPGLEELALDLAAGADSPLRREVETRYPTGALAEIALAQEFWRDAAGGRLVRFVRPRDLDPGSGSDG